MKLLKKLGYLIGRKNALGFPVRHNEYGVAYVDTPVHGTAITYKWDNVVNPISRKDVVAWIKALRSGKYKQTTGRLHATPRDEDCDNGGYCCLGVFANTKDALTEKDGSSYFTVNEIMLSTHTLTVDKGVPHFLPRALQDEYANLNDGASGGITHTFAQIADRIEKDFNIV